MERLKKYNSENPGYIQFPLCLLQKTYEDPVKGFNLILEFGIINYAMKFKFTLNEVARQLIYCYQNKKEIIQFNLLHSLESYIKDDFSLVATFDPDHNGFEKNVFEPDTTEMLIIFKADHKFRDEAILFYKVKQSVESLNMSNFNIDRALKSYNEGIKYKENFELKFGPDCWPGVKVSQICEFRDNLKDVDLFRAYIGIRSMVGRNSFVTTNHPAILSRMIGCKNKASFEYFTTDKYNKNKNLLPTVEKFTGQKHQRQRIKLLETLSDRKFIMYLSKRGVSVIYISGSFMEPEELGRLVKQARENKMKNSLKQRIKKVTACL